MSRGYGDELHDYQRKEERGREPSSWDRRYAVFGFYHGITETINYPKYPSYNIHTYNTASFFFQSVNPGIYFTNT